MASVTNNFWPVADGDILPGDQLPTSPRACSRWWSGPATLTGAPEEGIAGVTREALRLARAAPTRPSSTERWCASWNQVADTCNKRLQEGKPWKLPRPRNRGDCSSPAPGHCGPFRSCSGR